MAAGVVTSAAASVEDAAVGVVVVAFIPLGFTVDARKKRLF